MHFIEDADPHWPTRAAAEIAIWSDVLGDALIACHHIGSTSVPNLAAKPVIDLLPVVTSRGALSAQTSALVAKGYEAMGAFGLEGRLYFRKSTPTGTRLIQAHAFAEGDPAITRHLAFRDLLRADPVIRQSYENIKRHADRTSKGDINAYMDLKDPWIKQHEHIALHRFG